MNVESEINFKSGRNKKKFLKMLQSYIEESMHVVFVEVYLFRDRQ